MDLEKAYDKIYRFAYFKLNNQALAEDYEETAAANTETPEEIAVIKDALSILAGWISYRRFQVGGR